MCSTEKPDTPPRLPEAPKLADKSARETGKEDAARRRAASTAGGTLLTGPMGIDKSKPGTLLTGA